GHVEAGGGEEGGTGAAAAGHLPALRAVIVDVGGHVPAAGEGGPARLVDADGAVGAPLGLEAPARMVVVLDAEVIPRVHLSAVARGRGAVATVVGAHEAGARLVEGRERSRGAVPGCLALGHAAPGCVAVV